MASAITDTLLADDLRGLNQLAIETVTGTTDLVEAMHAAIAYLPSALGHQAPERTTGVSGWVYRRVRGTARLAGAGIEAVVSTLAPVLRARGAGEERDAVLAALNGVLGNHLEASGNPLAIRMCLRRDGRALRLTRKALATALPDANGNLLVLVHGLCMNDHQWRHQGHDHGAALARELGMSALYLHYNSGRHIARNGAAFATLLERLVAAWPVPVERVVLVGHSMGGLVARSACRHAEQRGHAWRRALSDVVFLGTPHHGAPLERAGNRVDRLLGLSPYSAPLALIGKLRSAGIQDLRHGNVGHADAPAGKAAARQPPALPAGVRCHAIAASTQAADTGHVAAHPHGDGLVPVASALGEYPDPAFDLRIPSSRKWIGHGIGHLQLLGSDAVYRRIKASLSRPVRTRRGQHRK